MMSQLEGNFSRNGTLNHDMISSDSSENSVLKVLRTLSYIGICLIGTFGNVLVLLATCKHRMRNVTNLFIANLALADLAVCVFSIPISLAYTSLEYWPFGSMLCKTMPYLQGITVSASIGTLVAIAADRFVVIVYPTKRKLKLSHTWFAIAFIWGLSTMVTIPINIHSELVYDTVDGVNRTFCMEIWPSRVAQRTYTLFVFVVLFVVPLCAMSAMYTAIIVKFKKLHPTQEVVTLEWLSVSLQLSHWNGCPALLTAIMCDSIGVVAFVLVALSLDVVTKQYIYLLPATLRTHKKVIKMLVVVIVTFAVCWIPYHVMFLYLDKSGFRTTEELTTLVLFFQWLMYANSACNPIVYAVCNLNYRREFIQMLKCKNNH